jgi:hypothetical protein
MAAADDAAFTEAGAADDVAGFTFNSTVSSELLAISRYGIFDAADDDASIIPSLEEVSSVVVVVLGEHAASTAISGSATRSFR